ncbi:hypothetical protein IAQ61_007570 [Plenodomus lingam]|nr:hypothetical protein IAQ61_007570 [Plenodomus lingam]
MVISREQRIAGSVVVDGGDIVLQHGSTHEDGSSLSIDGGCAMIDERWVDDDGEDGDGVGAGCHGSSSPCS